MTSTRSLFAAGALVVVIAGVVLYLSRPATPTVDPSVGAADRDVRKAEPEATPDPELVELTSDENDGASTESRRVAEDESVAERPTDEASVPVVALAGVVVIEELDGSLTRPDGGQVSIIATDGGGGPVVEIPIEGGAWQLDLFRDAEGVHRTEDGADGFDPKDGDVEYGAMYVEVAGESGATVEAFDAEQRYAFGTTGVELTLRRVSPVVLDVRDADTDEPVRDVRVVAVRRHEWARNGQRHPGDAPLDVLIERGDSPVTLSPTSQDARQGARPCLVGSPNHAWTLVELDFSGGGERRVELGPGGALVVTVRGTQKKSAVLRLFGADDSQPYSAEALDGATTYTFEGLVPGEYEARAQLGKWFRSPATEGTAAATVVANATERVELQLEGVPEVARARVSGRIVLPTEWELDRFYVTFKLQGPSLDGTDGRITLHRHRFEQVGSSADTYSFALGEVQVGRWEMTLSQLEYGIAFDLGPEGRSDVLMEVPPPVEISVLLRDASTGAVADLDRMLWNAVRPEGNRGGGLESVEREEGAERFHLRVPRGPIELSCWSDDYVHKSETVEAVEGGAFEIELERAASALLRLMDGDALVPWPEDDYGKGLAVDNDGRLGSRGRREGALWLTVTAPGRYRFEVPKINGFEDHETFVLDLVRGETVEHTIELKRKR